MPTSPRQPFTAVLFDMDGTLLDSERIAYAGFEATCAQFGISADFAAYCRCIGTRGEHTREILADLIGGRIAVDAFFTAWEEHYLRHAVHASVPVKRGAAELLGMLGERGIPMAVVTSTRIAHARKKLRSAGLLAHFEFIIGGDQVPQSKPEPLIYLRATERIGHPPERCLAVEDSANGIIAAHRAGCQVVHIPDLAPLPAEFDAYVGDRFRSLDDLGRHLRAVLDAV